MVAVGALLANKLSDAASLALIVLGSGMFFIAMVLPALTEFQIGPKGFSGKLRERDDEVRATLEPESAGLLETAIGLAGDEQAGRELLERALVETYVRWSQAKHRGPVEMVREQLGELAPVASEGPVGAAKDSRG
jgi:hypothetical protein